MQTRDFIAIVALLISLFSLAITFSQRFFESRRATRAQTTILMTEIARALSADQGDQSSGHRLVILTRQAIYLIESEPKLMKDVDYVTIAQGVWRTRDNELADVYFRKAIDNATGVFMKVLARTQYADFLAHNGRTAEMATYYQGALALVDRASDNNKALAISVLLRSHFITPRCAVSL